MKHLGNELIQKGFDEKNQIERVSARAVILNENKEVLLIYSKFYDDVSFPGGGVDGNESIIEALHRECLEEVGAKLSSYKELFKITEKRAPANTKENVFTSCYFLCECSEYVENSLLDYEVKLGYQTKWMSIDEAIKLNSLTLEKLYKNNKYPGVVERELIVLNELKRLIEGGKL